MIHLANVALSIITAAVGLEVFLMWLLVIGFEYMQWPDTEKFSAFLSGSAEKQQQ